MSLPKDSSAKQKWLAIAEAAILMDCGVCFSFPWQKQLLF